MTNCDTKLISEAKIIRKKDPYVNGNAFIQPLVPGKSKDIDTFSVTQGRYDSLNDTRNIPVVVQESTKDFGSKEGRAPSRPVLTPNYTVEYNLMTDYDAPHDDVYYMISDNIAGKSKDLSYTQNKGVMYTDVPNYMTPLNKGVFEQNTAIKETKIIKMV